LLEILNTDADPHQDIDKILEETDIQIVNTKLKDVINKLK